MMILPIFFVIAVASSEPLKILEERENSAREKIEDDEDFAYLGYSDELFNQRLLLQRRLNNDKEVMRNIAAFVNLDSWDYARVFPVLSALNGSFLKSPDLAARIVEAILGKIARTDNESLSSVDQVAFILDKRLQEEMPILNFIHEAKWCIFRNHDECKRLIEEIREKTPTFEEQAKQYLVYLFLEEAKRYRPHDTNSFFSRSLIDMLIKGSNFILTLGLNPQSKNALAKSFADTIESCRIETDKLKEICKCIVRLNPDLRKQLIDIVTLKMDSNLEYYQDAYPSILQAIVGSK